MHFSKVLYIAYSYAYVYNIFYINNKETYFVTLIIRWLLVYPSCRHTVSGTNCMLLTSCFDRDTYNPTLQFHQCLDITSVVCSVLDQCMESKYLSPLQNNSTNFSAFKNVLQNQLLMLSWNTCRHVELQTGYAIIQFFCDVQ